MLQVGRILFLHNPAWNDDDENRMAATMFLPILFVTHGMVVAVGILLSYTCTMYWSVKPAGKRGFELIERAHSSTTGRVRLQQLVTSYKSGEQGSSKSSV